VLIFDDDAEDDDDNKNKPFGKLGLWARDVFTSTAQEANLTLPFMVYCPRIT
jgi:hypothetical protein